MFVSYHMTPVAHAVFRQMPSHDDILRMYKQIQLNYGYASVRPSPYNRKRFAIFVAGRHFGELVQTLRIFNRETSIVHRETICKWNIFHDYVSAQEGVS